MTLGADNSVATTDLIGLTRFKTNTDDSQFAAAEIKGLLNIGQRELQVKILDFMDSWDFNGQIATADLKDSNISREYTWPLDLLAIKRMDVLADGTNSFHAKAIDTATLERPLMDENDFRAAFRGLTVAYDAFDQGFILYTGQAIPVTIDGIRIEYTEQITDLSASSDTPVFIEGFQPWLSAFAAKAFFDRYEQPNKAQRVANEMTEMERHIGEYYSRRNRDDSQRPRISVRRNSWHYR